MSNAQNDVIKENIYDDLREQLPKIIEQMELAERAGGQGLTWQEVKQTLMVLNSELELKAKLNESKPEKQLLLDTIEELTDEQFQEFVYEWFGEEALSDMLKKSIEMVATEELEAGIKMLKNIMK